MELSQATSLFVDGWSGSFSLVLVGDAIKSAPDEWRGIAQLALEGSAAAARGAGGEEREQAERRDCLRFFLLASFFLPVSFLITNGAPHHGGEAVEKGGGSAACIWLSSHAVSFPACR